MTGHDDIALARAAKRVTVYRPKSGKPSIECMESAVEDVRKALDNAGGWKEIKKVAKALGNKGYNVRTYGEGAAE